MSTSLHPAPLRVAIGDRVTWSAPIIDRDVSGYVVRDIPEHNAVEVQIEHGGQSVVVHRSNITAVNACEVCETPGKRGPEGTFCAECGEELFGTTKRPKKKVTL